MSSICIICSLLLSLLCPTVHAQAHAKRSHISSGSRSLFNKLRVASSPSRISSRAATEEATGSLSGYEEDDEETHIEATSAMDGFTIYHKSLPSETASLLAEIARPSSTGGSSVQTEGITFFLTNLHETESVEVDSISFWMELPLPAEDLDARLVHREGDESSDPQFTSEANPWTLLVEADSFLHVTPGYESAGMVKIPSSMFRQKLMIAPQSTITFFFFVNNYSGLLNVRSSPMEEVTDEGSIRIASGSAVSKNPDSGRWETMPDVTFAGVATYKPPTGGDSYDNKASQTLPGGGPSMEVDTFMDTATSVDNIPKSYGVMFDLECQSDDGCLVTSIDVQTTAVDLSYVDIYVRKEGYQGGLQSLETWTQVASQAPILGHGLDTPTPIPTRDFDAILIGAHTTVGLYVTMPTPDLVYHVTSSSIGNQAPDEFVKEASSAPTLALKVGESVPFYPLGQPGASLAVPRVFSGVIHYKNMGAVTEPPSLSPTMAPTAGLEVLPPSPKLPSEEVLQGHMDGGEQGQAIYFDVMAKDEPVVIDGLELVVAGNLDPAVADAELSGESALQVFYTLQSFEGKEDKLNVEWFEVPATYDSISPAEGSQRALQESSLVRIFISPVLLEPGQSGGFYIKSPVVPLVFSYGDQGSSVGSPWVDDDRLELFMGKARQNDELIAPRGMNGNVLYTTEEQAPTNISGDLETQQKLIIAGMSRRKLLNEASADGHTLSDDDLRIYFEELGKQFLDRLLNNGDIPVGITKVMVFPQINSADLGGRLLQEDDIPELEVYTTILGEYSPPPVVDFSSLVEDGFNTQGDGFLADLKDDSPQMGRAFAEARSIKAETVSFPMPTDPIEEPEDRQMGTPDPGISLMTWVWIASGILAIFLLIIVISLRYQMKKHAKKVKRQEEERAKADEKRLKRQEDAEARKAASIAAMAYRSQQRSMTPVSYDPRMIDPRSRLSSPYHNPRLHSSFPNSRIASPYSHARPSSAYDSHPGHPDWYPGESPGGGRSVGVQSYYPHSVAQSEMGGTQFYPPSYMSASTRQSSRNTALDRISDEELRAQVLNILADQQQQQHERLPGNHPAMSRMTPVPTSVGVNVGHDNVSIIHDPTVVASPKVRGNVSTSSTLDETLSSGSPPDQANRPKVKATRPSRPAGRTAIARGSRVVPASPSRPKSQQRPPQSSSNNTPPRGNGR